MKNYLVVIPAPYKQRVSQIQPSLIVPQQSSAASGSSLSHNKTGVWITMHFQTYLHWHYIFRHLIYTFHYVTREFWHKTSISLGKHHKLCTNLHPKHCKRSRGHYTGSPWRHQSHHTFVCYRHFQFRRK